MTVMTEYHNTSMQFIHLISTSGQGNTHRYYNLTSEEAIHSCPLEYPEAATKGCS